MLRPLLFLDVDGVLLPIGPGTPAGYEPARAGPFRVFVSPALRGAMPELLAAFEVRWLTSWNHDANLEVGPIFAMPRLPVVEIKAHWMKLQAIRTAAPPDRAVAWAEDRMRAEAHDWVREREAPTLLLAPDAKLGLTPSDVDQLLAFGAAHGSS